MSEIWYVWGKLESPQNAKPLVRLRKVIRAMMMWFYGTFCQISLGRVDCDEVSRNSNEIVVPSYSKGEN